MDRRTFLQGGMSAAALGVLARQGIALSSKGDCVDTGAATLASARPFKHIPLHPKSVMVDGIPFARWFDGDFFGNEEMPFHTCENCFDGGKPPSPTEEVDVAIVGGGISGLSTAYLLREFKPVVFELRPRFGGAAQGEVWAGTRYSLGSAYVITPDPGTFLEQIYSELNLPQVVEVDQGEMMMELGGEVLDGFWRGEGSSPQDAAAFAAYAAVVQQMANVDYPDIPLPDGDVQWILDLDQKSLKQDIEEKMGMPAPPLLAAAIQSYCYSSFVGGWDEISAAGGWNFLAAEEFGRWVAPGGNAYMAQQLWNKLLVHEDPQRSGCSGEFLRGQCAVVDVRLAPRKRVQVTYRDARGMHRSLLAKRVVMACPKMLCKYIIHDIDVIDPPKLQAMHDLTYQAYVMVNVLINKPFKKEFYDIFLLRDGHFPMSPDQAADNPLVIDVLNGGFARANDSETTVLTLYWPLPFTTARFTLIAEDAWENYAASLAGQLKQILGIVGLTPSDVRQVRMTRWGHAVPLHRPNLIAGGVVENLRRPYEDLVYFVNQDNWALPAIENCLLDAEIFAPQVAAGLRK